MCEQISVLLVDDSATCAAVAPAFANSRFLLRCVHEAIEVGGALAAARFHIVVASVRLAMPDGTPVLSRVSASQPRIRPIALVDRPDVASVQLAMKFGCKSYLAKPVSATALFDVVRDVARTTGLLTISERELQLRLSKLLRNERIRQKLTLSDIAERVQVSKAQLSQIELAKCWPSFPTLKRILDELDQPFSRLFQEVEQAAG